jgi:hypothetical protein
LSFQCQRYRSVFIPLQRITLDFDPPFELRHIPRLPFDHLQVAPG